MVVLVLRTPGDPSNIAKAVRTEVDTIDKDQPVGDVLTMRQLVDNKLADRRSTTALIGVFALIAVLLTTIGVFGLVSYSVSCRTNEIGIRMALGARSSRIVAMITLDTLAFGVVGVAAGTLVSLGASRLFTGMLYGVAPADPYILCTSAALMATIIILSGIFATRRVIMLDPIVSIRHE